MAINFAGCGNNTNKKATEKETTIEQAETEEVIEEYRMRDIEEKLTLIYERLKQDLTDDELRDDKVFAKAWSKECREEGLPVNKKIRIRGTVSNITTGDNDEYINIILEGSGDWEYMSGNLQCSFKKEKYPQIMFAERDSNIVIEGIFCKDEKTYGMADCEIISPEIKEKYFINNISDVVDGAYESYDLDEVFYKYKVDIYAKVSDIILLDDETKEKLRDVFRNEENISIEIEIFDYLLELTDEEGEEEIFIFCSQKDGKNLKIGNNIYINATLSRSSYVEGDTRYISVYGDLYKEPIYIYD